MLVTEKNGNLLNRRCAFHTPTNIPPSFSQQWDEESVIVIDGFWGVDIRFPEWGGDAGGNWIEGGGLGEVRVCELDLGSGEAVPTRPDLREQSMKLEPTTTPYFSPWQKWVSLGILISRGLVPDVMSSLCCFNKIDSTFLSSGVRSGLMEMWGVWTVDAYWPVWKPHR